MNWGAGSFGETNWTIVYGPAGFDPLSAGTTLTSTVTSVTIPGLTQITIYDVYIYADCDPGNIQSVGLSGTFATLPNCSDVTGITANNKVHPYILFYFFLNFNIENIVYDLGYPAIEPQLLRNLPIPNYSEKKQKEIIDLVSDLIEHEKYLKEKHKKITSL